MGGHTLSQMRKVGREGAGEEAGRRRVARAAPAAGLCSLQLHNRAGEMAQTGHTTPEIPRKRTPRVLAFTGEGEEGEGGERGRSPFLRLFFR